MKYLSEYTQGTIIIFFLCVLVSPILYVMDFDHSQDRIINFGISIWPAIIIYIMGQKTINETIQARMAF